MSNTLHTKYKVLHSILNIPNSVYRWCTKTRLRKILSGTLAVLMLLTSIRFIFVKPTPVSASDVFIKFDEGYGTTGAVNDSNGTISAGNIVNAVWKTEDLCKSGKCLYFDGTGDYVSFADDANLDMAASDEVTISLWFRTGDITSGTKTLISKYETTGADGGYRIYMNSDGKIVFGIDSDNSGFPLYSVTSTNAYDDNRWHFVSVVKNGTSSMSVYVDAMHQGTTSITSTNASNDDTFYIGIDNALANGFTGFIDEVRVQRTARTAEEIKSDVLGSTSEGTAASFGGGDQTYLSNGLVGYWKMDESSGVASDSAGLNYHLTNNGTTTYAAGKFSNGSEHVPASTQYFSTGTSSQDTYYFDTSDGGPTDPNNVWTNDPNAFDGSSSTYAQTMSAGSSSSNYLMGEGTNAPGTGNTITSVESRIDASSGNPGLASVISLIYTDGLGQSLGNNQQSDDGFTSYSTLTTPTGGWTWEKVQSLETKSYSDTGGESMWLRKIEVRVNSSNISTIAGVKTISFWTNPDALTNYYVSLTSGAYITSNSSGVLSATGFTDPKIYVNGVPGNTITANTWQLVTVTTETAINADTFYIGRQGTNYFDGTMDEVRLYNRALTSSEISKLYNWAPGPVGYWKMDEGTGTTAYDSSGNGNTGTMNGFAPSDWIPGKYGSALNFDNNNNQINAGTGSTLDDLSALTFSSWIYVRSVSSGEDTIVVKGTSGGSTLTNGWNLQVQSISDILSFRVYYDGGTILLASTNNSTVPNDEWVHVAVTWDGTSSSSGIRFYINGNYTQNVNTTNGTGNRASDESQNLYIGMTSDNGKQFDGLMDDLRIYNYIRTPAQIIEDMNAGHPAPGSPVGSALLHLKFDEGYGDTAYNSGNVGSALNGDLGGSGQTCPATTETTCPAWHNSGKFGKTLEYDNADDYVIISDHDSLSFGNSTSDQPFTISAWVKTDTNETAGDIVSKYDTSIPATEYRLWMNSDKIYFYIYDDSSGRIGKIGRTTLADLAWYHVLATYDGSGSATGMKIYVNGVRDDAVVDNNGSYVAMENTTAPLYLGVHSASLVSDFDGWIDEVKIYNQELTADQAKVEYNAGFASVWGATSTDSTGAASNASVNEYCPPGQSSTCTGPVAEWKFDENTGTSAYDTSGNGHTGSLGNGTASEMPVWVPAKKSSGLKFDGSDDEVRVADHSNIRFDGSTQDFSIFAWVKIDSGTTGSIATKLDASTDGYYMNWRAVGGELSCRLNGVADYNAGYPVINDGSWHFVGCIFDRDGNIYFFQDGSYVDSATSISGESLATTTDLVIGNTAPWGSQNSIDGIMDHVQIYNYAVGPSQAAWLYNRGGPVGWWRFDECTGTTANDASGNGNHGTITPGASGQTSVGSCSTNANTMWYNGRNGKFNGSLNFDGTDDTVTIPVQDMFSFTDGTRDLPFTFAAWIKTTGSGYGYIISKSNLFTNNREYHFILDVDAYLELHLRNGGRIVRKYTTALETNVWHHVVGTYDGSETSEGIRLYVNGKRVDNLTDDAGSYSKMANTSADLMIGHEIGPSGDPGRVFNGQIDDVRIYNYVLTPQQILSVMNQGALRFGP